MSKDQEIKIIPPKTTRNSKPRKTKQPNYVLWFMALIIIYFVLLLLVSLLSLPGYMKVLSLVLGTFLLFDIEHSIKYYVKNR